MTGHYCALVMRTLPTFIRSIALVGVAVALLGAIASDRFITTTLTQQWELFTSGSGDLAPSKKRLRFTTSGGVDPIPDPIYGASRATCFISEFRLPRVSWTTSVDATQAIASSALPADSEFLMYIRSVQTDFVFPLQIDYEFCMYVKVTPAATSIGYSAFETTTDIFGGPPVRVEVLSDEVLQPKSSKPFVGKLVYSYNPTGDLLTMKFGKQTLTIPGYMNTVLPASDIVFWQPVVGIGCSANYEPSDPLIAIQPFNFRNFKATNLTLPGIIPDPPP